MKRLVLAVALASAACAKSASPPAAPPEPAAAPAATDTTTPATATPTATPTATATATATPTPTPTPDRAAPPAAAAPGPSSVTSTSTSDPSDSSSSFDMTVVNGVYKEHRDTLRASCWDHSKSSEKAYLGKATIRLAPTGKVISSTTDGTDAAASACVDKQIKKWKFPPPNGTATITLPIHMHRD